jgi:hypothetical protein
MNQKISALIDSYRDELVSTLARWIAVPSVKDTPAPGAPFGTEVRRAFGLEAARAVLGHTGGGCVTDVYTFDALADEMVRKAAPAVEALG